MRMLTDHVVDIREIDNLKIEVQDEPGQGGANHLYHISFTQESEVGTAKGGAPVTHYSAISFQKGPIKEFGVNGITQEALLAICIDRLRGFQSGDYKCRENAIALTHLEEALMWLQKRTRERMARGVEGTNQQ